MLDIWSFLLQTLTASGAALLLLLLKALFRDKLPPKWHFAVWGVLGILLLLPAGFQGRYILFRWQVAVAVLKTWCGDFTFSRVLFPFPGIPLSLPKTVGDWLFVIYLLGVIAHGVHYLVSYCRLRAILRRSREADRETQAQIHIIAQSLGVKPCRVVSVAGLPSAFVCGVLRPILALPAGIPMDDKILMHELLHLKSRDTLWNTVICLLRCIHWCNPLLVFCANQALNDLESRCDQRVLEQLEGEERREYGLILLSMANDRYARTPGSTCMHNGGRNIRSRIEAIARFKLYPAGMELVSACTVVILALSMVVGVQATEVYIPDYQLPSGIAMDVALASARSTPCTTPAGAFDTYAKAILDQNGIYRAMCAPEYMQRAIADALLQRQNASLYPNWDAGLPAWPNATGGYYIYNLRSTEYGGYEGLLVVKLNYPPNGKPAEDGLMYLAVQTLRVEKEHDRWVAIALEEFRAVETPEQNLKWGCEGLPGIIYSGTAAGIRTEVRLQSIHLTDNTVSTENNLLFGSTTYYDTTPKPSAQFTWESICHSSICTHLGSAEERAAISQIGLSVAPLYQVGPRPQLRPAAYGTYSSGANSDGEEWTSRKPESGWGPEIQMGGGGTSGDISTLDWKVPLSYAADLYLNHKLAAQMTLYPQEEVNP